MATLEAKTMAPLRILQILHEHSDCDHPLTQEDIADYLDRDYGILLERKAIGRHLKTLRSADFPIESVRSGSYLAQREFEDAELRMLIDGVLASKYIAANYSADLIEKLCKLSNKRFRSHVKNIYSVNDWSKTDNKQLFGNIDLIDDAIEQGVQLKFTFNKYGVDKKLHRSSTPRVTPYQLILHNQRYYLMAAHAHWKTSVNTLITTMMTDYFAVIIAECNEELEIALEDFIAEVVAASEKYDGEEAMTEDEVRFELGLMTKETESDEEGNVTSETYIPVDITAYEYVIKEITNQYYNMFGDPTKPAS